MLNNEHEEPTQEEPISEKQWCEGCGWMIETPDGFAHNWGCVRGDVFMFDPRLQQPQIPVGWICSRCGRIYAPTISTCDCTKEI